MRKEICQSNEIKERQNGNGRNYEKVRLVEVDDDSLRQLHVEFETQVEPESPPPVNQQPTKLNQHSETDIIVASTCVSEKVTIREESSDTPFQIEILFGR